MPEQFRGKWYFLVKYWSDHRCKLCVLLIAWFLIVCFHGPHIIFMHLCGYALSTHVLSVHLSDLWQLLWLSNCSGFCMLLLNVKPKIWTLLILVLLLLLPGILCLMKLDTYINQPLHSDHGWMNPHQETFLVFLLANNENKLNAFCQVSRIFICPP